MGQVARRLAVQARCVGTLQGQEGSARHRGPGASLLSPCGQPGCVWERGDPSALGSQRQTFLQILL